MHYKQTTHKNVVAVSIVEERASHEYLKADFTSFDNSAHRTGFIADLQSHVDLHHLPQSIEFVLLDYMWMPVSGEWLHTSYLKRQGNDNIGLLCNITSLCEQSEVTKVHLVQGERDRKKDCALTYFLHTFDLPSLSNQTPGGQVIIPTNVVMWNELTSRTEQWNKISQIFEVKCTF